MLKWLERLRRRPSEAERELAAQLDEELLRVGAIADERLTEEEWDATVRLDGSWVDFDGPWTSEDPPEIWVRLVGPVWWEDFPPGVPWEGSVEDVLTRLREIPDGAGAPAVWAHFHSHAPEAQLWADLDRVGVGGGLDAEDYVELQREEPGLVSLSSSLVLESESESGWSGTYSHAWTGETAEALRRVKELPDGTGLAAFWDAFPEATDPRTEEGSA
jgi:hypothetical protein